LVSTAIAIADIVKMKTKRKAYQRQQQLTELLSALEDEIQREVNNKSVLLSKILAIEIYFFSKNREEVFPSKRVQYNLDQRRDNETKENITQGPSWFNSNQHFGSCLKDIDLSICSRFKTKPVMKKNYETGQSYLDKNKFL